MTSCASTALSLTAIMRNGWPRTPRSGEENSKTPPGSPQSGAGGSAGGGGGGGDELGAGDALALGA